MWYLIPFSHIIHWDGVGTRNNVQVWVTVCGNTAFLIFVHLSFIVLSSAHSSKKHRILSHLLRVISINWSPWVVPLFQERRGMMCQGMKSRCCPPSTLVCAKGSAWLWSLKMSVHCCPSSPSLTLVPSRLAAFQLFSWPPRGERNIWLLLEPNETQRNSLMRPQSHLLRDPLWPPLLKTPQWFWGWGGGGWHVTYPGRIRGRKHRSSKFSDSSKLTWGFSCTLPGG